MIKDRIKDKNSAVVVTGISIVLITAIIVSAIIFYPSVKARSVLRDMEDMLFDAKVKSATVYDPGAGNDIFNEGGTQHIATESESKKLSELIVKITSDATYSSKDNSDIFFDYDYRIRFRFESDKTISFFFSNGMFYVTNEGTRYFFVTKDEAAYIELFSFAESLINSENT